MAESDQNDSERSEDPTQKRLDEALQRGDVAKSQEVSTWFVMAAGALVLATFSSPMSGGLSSESRYSSLLGSGLAAVTVDMMLPPC